MQTPHPKARSSQQSDPLGRSGVVSGSDELSEPQCCPDRADQTGAGESRPGKPPVEPGSQPPASGDNQEKRSCRP
jgi:hypothetical protein